MRRHLWWAAPPLLALCLMLPRVLSAQFGLLDDGMTLRTADATLADPLLAFHVYAQHGRFMPVLVYYGLLVAQLSRHSALGFFIANALAFALLVLLSAVAARRFGASRMQAATAGIALALSGPALATFYTLSKAELPQALALAASLCAGGLPAMFGALLLAVLSKETSIAIVPIALAWWLLDRRPARERRYLAGAILAAAAFLLTAYIAMGTLPGGGDYGQRYQAANTGVLAMSATRAAGWLLRDYTYLLPPLCALPFVWRRLTPELRREVWRWLAWTGGFLAVFLPWPGLLEYHLLPAAIGIAILAGFLLPVLARLLPAVAAASLLLFAANTVTAWSTARSQLLLDRVNERLLDEMLKLPRGSRTLVNYEYGEYTFELALLLGERRGRPDLAPALETRAPAPGDILLEPLEDGLDMLMARCGFHAPTLGVWARRVAQVPRETVAEFWDAESVTDFAFDRLVCYSPLERYGLNCWAYRSLVERRSLRYGWRISRVLDPAVAPR